MALTEQAVAMHGLLAKDADIAAPIQKHVLEGVGMKLLGAIFAAVLWVLHDFGVLDLDNKQMNVWLGLFGLSAVLGVGLGWSHVRRSLTGQADVDDVDE